MNILFRSLGAAILLFAGTVQAYSTDLHTPSPAHSDYDFADPLWVVRAGMAILARSGPHLIPGAGQTVTNSSGFDWGGGPDVYVARRINSRDWIEARHFNVQNWRSDYLFNDGLPYEGTYNAGLYSTEINFRRQYSDNFALLAGFRWVELHDQFNNELVGGGFSFDTKTGASLYGGQIGAEGVLWRHGDAFRVEGWAKAGIYGTHNRGHFTNTVGFNETSKESTVSFVGDLGITGIYQVTEGIGVRAGYQVLWIGGVALAGNQLQYSTDPPPLPLDTSGGVFAHGALLSVDFSW